MDSTNAEARRQVETGKINPETAPLWITSKIQTAGRGRRGRDWVSKSGNLFATLVISSPISLTTASQLSFVTALAIYETAAAMLPDQKLLELKWPNDILLAEKKLAGILIETISTDNKAHSTLAIGCGINLQHAPDETAYGATWLNAHCKQPVSDMEFLQSLDLNMKSWLQTWQNGQCFARIANAWQQRTSHIGRVISLSSNNRTTVGKFVKLAEDGALVLERADGRQQHFHAGDVSYSPFASS